MITTTPRVATQCALLHGAVPVVVADGLDMDHGNLLHTVGGGQCPEPRGNLRCDQLDTKAVLPFCHITMLAPYHICKHRHGTNSMLSQFMRVEQSMWATDTHTSLCPLQLKRVVAIQVTGTRSLPLSLSISLSLSLSIYLSLFPLNPVLQINRPSRSAGVLGSLPSLVEMATVTNSWCCQVREATQGL